VVTGQDHDRLQAVLSSYPVAVAYNDRYEHGMLSSVRCGLTALPEGCQAVMVALGDQPSLTSRTVNQLLDHFRTHGKIVVPVHQGKRGHPLIFSSVYIPSIQTQFDQMGLRGLLQTREQDILEVSVESADILWDLDTPEDYQRHREAPPG